jgi:hypothetical protein
VPSLNREALEALQQAAHGWRRREALASPLETQRSRLLAWVNSRPDLEEPTPFDRLALASPLPAGLRVLMPGDPDPWHLRLRLHAPLMATWLPLHPLEGIHISRVSPISLLWSEEPAERAMHCGALALLRNAAGGSGTNLGWILNQLGWPAAAALVKQYQDEDEIYEVGAGRVPTQLPSPRRLLRAAFADRPRELTWLDELCDGGDNWDSGPGALPVPRGEALLPGQQVMPPAWITKI